MNGLPDKWYFETRLILGLLKEIRNIIQTYDASDPKTENLALASVVNVEESSYRRIGARMLVSSNGQWIGGISGGCLEGDALKRSQKAIYKNESSLVIYDTLEDDKNQIWVGLGCNGKIEVLFTPIDRDDPLNPIEQLRFITNNTKPCILLKVIEVAVNKKLLGFSKLADSELTDLDFCEVDSNDLLSKVRETRIKRRPQIISLNNQSGDSLKILVEFIRPETKIVIVGDNYDVNALVGIVAELGWDIYIVGRSKKLSKSIFTRAKQVYEYEDFDEVVMDEYTAVVLMSHDYNWDKNILPKVILKSPSYIGMLGPRKRMDKMKLDLGIEYDLSKIDHFYSPVGLDIGAESPEEIALAIAAEIVACLRNRDGQFLKDRPGTIHERI